MPRSKYTREVLEPVVAKSRSLSDVIRAFGLKPTGGNFRYFTAVIFKAGLDTNHFSHGRAGRRLRALPQAELEEIVRTSSSFAQVVLRLGLQPEGRPHRDVSQRVHALGLDISHFRGAGWAKGQTKQTNASIARHAHGRSLPDAEVFIEGSLITGKGLTPRLLDRGWKYECSICGITEWQGRALRLQLDHINGKHYDNRLENLRFLCPNCHSQTPTYGNSARDACYTTDFSRAWRNRYPRQF